MLQGGITDPGNYWYQQDFNAGAIPKDHPLKSNVLTLKACLIDWLIQTGKIKLCRDALPNRLLGEKITWGIISASLACEWADQLPNSFPNSFPFGVNDPEVLKGLKHQHLFVLVQQVVIGQT